MTDDRTADPEDFLGAEQELLKRALKASGMSARQAASKMDISDTRLRHIVNGYQPVGRGERIRVYAPEDTLARIAIALDISPEDLESVDRGDAARELRKRLREQHETGDDSGAVIDAIREWAEDPVNYLAPDDALRFFDDSALLGEVGRRMSTLREMARGVVRHGYWDTSGHPTVETTERFQELDEQPEEGEEGEVAGLDIPPRDSVQSVKIQANHAGEGWTLLFMWVGGHEWATMTVSDQELEKFIEAGYDELRAERDKYELIGHIEDHTIESEQEVDEFP